MIDRYSPVLFHNLWQAVLHLRSDFYHLQIHAFYIVSVPDLPGCMADGKTPNEAYENAKLVIKQWIDTVRAAGREIPTPTFGQDNF